MSPEDVKKLADLARLEIGDDEAKEVAPQLGQILEYLSLIKEANIGDAKKEAGTLRNIFRDDIDPTETGVWKDRLLKEAPSREGDYVKVKKIL